MREETKLKWKKMLLLSLKISVGSSLAIFVAERMHLQFASSAGTIAMLTLVTTKWETLKLSFLRIGTFLISVAICWSSYHMVHSRWIAFGIFLFLLILICEHMGWRSTVSVNAVIGTHLLTTQDYTFSFLMNEFMLVVIGLAIAVILNLFHINSSHEAGIIKSMRHVEHKMRKILEKLAFYLECQKVGDGVWDDIIELESELEDFIEQASEYQNNTFSSHPSYYISYFEMRMKQCGVLHNLHYEMKRIREIPRQASVIADYIKDITKHVTEMNEPEAQMRQLEEMLEHMKDEPLPTDFQEFEDRAKLYHIIMDMEEFLIYKQRFIESIDERQFQIYWKREVEGK